MKRTQRFTAKVMRYGITLLSFFAVLSMIACSGTAVAPPPANDGGPKFNSPPPLSNVQVKIGDSPSDRVVALKLTLKSIQATPFVGDKVSLLSGSASAEVTHLAASNQLLAETTMPQGTYTKLVVSMSAATVTYLDAITGLPVQKTFASVPTSTITLSPALRIQSGGNVLNLDVDVAKTVNLDLIKGTVTLNAPVFNVSVQPIASSNQQPETGAVEHITGKVTSVSGGAFTIQAGPSGVSLTFGSDSSTVFVGTSVESLNGLIVDVEAESLADGTLLATEVDNVNTSSGVSVEGLVTGYTQWGYLNLVMQDGTGAGMNASMLGANLATAMDANTTFTFNSHDVDMTGLPFTFDVNSIVPGQRVQVNSANSAQTDPQGGAAGFVTAATIELQKQTLSGTVSNYQDNGDGTATFNLVLPSDGNSYLSVTSPGVTSIEVHTSAKTNWDELSGDPTGQSVKVRGFVFFYDPMAFSLHRNLRPFVGGGGQGSQPYFAMVASQVSQ